MSTYLDALLSGQSKARSLATNEDAIEVDVAESAPPNPGDVLTAVDSSHATWQPASVGGGTADAIGSSGDPINVSDAAPPVPGQVLTAVDPEHAVWRVPGLHYDPSIKFWTSSVGSATILPNSWGFIQEPPAATDPVVVYIVSSLEAPPVDSRFGLYVWREMTVPVTVNVLGESQIQGLDGVLGTSTVLLPGADYEWVFYHEDGFAIWGLVSDTAGVAKHLVTDSGSVALIGDPPNPGDVLTAAGDPSFAVWLPPGGGGGLTFVGSSAAPSSGQWCLVDSGITSVTMPSDAAADDTVGMFVASGQDGTLLHLPSGFELAFGNKIADPSAPLKLRGGAYYEWTLQPYGETSGRWLPRGMSNESPAPLASRGFGTIYPNEWVLSSDYSDVVNAPSAPQLGDCLAIYVNSASASVVPASGQSIVSPDGTTVISAPSALTLPGNTYYEWIWVASAAHWKPKNYLDAPGNGLIRSGKTLAVGANADASIVVNADDIRVGVLATDAQHGVRGGGTTHALATGSANGFLASADFTKVGALSQAFKEPVRIVAAVTITLSGLQTVDSVALNNGDRVLCTAQSPGTANGIYVAAAGAWARATDASTSAQLVSGAFIPVAEGNLYADTFWTLTTNNPIVLGTTTLAFSLTLGPRSQAAAPNPIDPAVAGATGITNTWAPSDHKHQLVPPDLNLSNLRISNNSGSSLSSDSSSGGVYIVPHNGNRIALYNGSVWVCVTLSGTQSVAVTAQTAGVPCDVFAFYSSLTSLTMELLPWANATTRATPLSQFNGVWIKQGAFDRRYLGTFLPDSATTFSHAANPVSAAKAVCGIWNQNNRVLGAFNWTPTFDSWAIPSANAWQQINAQTSATVQYVQGQSLDAVAAEHIGAASGTSGGSLGIGLDSTTVPNGYNNHAANTGIGALRARLNKLTPAGAHNLNALAYGNATSVTFYGAHTPMQGGLTADLWY